MTLEDGTSLTIIERGDPLHDPEYVGEFRSARRVWLGYPDGVEWLHDEAERRLGPAAGSFSVESRRSSTHVGASSEIATVIVEILGAGVAGKVISDLIDFARQRRRDAPDFAGWDQERLVHGLRKELADVLALPPDRLETTFVEEHSRTAAIAVYRDRETGREYRMEIGRDEVVFTRLEEPAENT